MRIAALALASLLALGACALPADPARPGARPAQGDAAPADTEELLAYFAHLRRLPPAELGRERELARRALSSDASDERRIRLAMALSVSPEPGGTDAARAAELLDAVARRRDPRYLSLAIALRGLVADLSQAQRDRAEAQRKLDSLKALEKSLSDREGAPK